jgi:hypothetical protein
MSKQSSRELFLETLKKAAQSPSVDSNIKQLFAKISTGEVQLADMKVYSSKLGDTGRTIKMFESQDEKAVGVRNVKGGRLQKGQVMLVTSIQLVAAAIGGIDPITTEMIRKADFGSIKGFAGLQNGEFSLKSNKKFIVAESSNQSFVKDGNTTGVVGEYVLDNPRFIFDDTELEFVIELGDNAPARTVLKVVLNGTATIPA